jgi:hypothetical protein
VSMTARSRAADHGAGLHSATVVYRPKARILILGFPRQGAYLYHNVPVGVYEMLRQSPVVRASFVAGRRHRYSVVTA